MTKDETLSKWADMSPADRDKWITEEIAHTTAPYSTDLTAAHALIDAMVQRRCIISVCHNPDANIHCNIWGADKPVQVVRGAGETVPEAVGLAALLYVGTYA